MPLQELDTRAALAEQAAALQQRRNLINQQHTDKMANIRLKAQMESQKAGVAFQQQQQAFREKQFAFQQQQEKDAAGRQKAKDDAINKLVGGPLVGGQPGGGGAGAPPAGAGPAAPPAGAPPGGAPAAPGGAAPGAAPGAQPAAPAQVPGVPPAGALPTTEEQAAANAAQQKLTTLEAEFAAFQKQFAGGAAGSPQVAARAMQLRNQITALRPQVALLNDTARLANLALSQARDVQRDRRGMLSALSSAASQGPDAVRAVMARAATTLSPDAIKAVRPDYENFLQAAQAAQDVKDDVTEATFATRVHTNFKSIISKWGPRMQYEAKQGNAQELQAVRFQAEKELLEAHTRWFSAAGGNPRFPNELQASVNAQASWFAAKLPDIPQRALGKVSDAWQPRLAELMAKVTGAKTHEASKVAINKAIAAGRTWATNVGPGQGARINDYNTLIHLLSARRMLIEEGPSGGDGFPGLDPR